MKKIDSYIICATPRSGSTLLCDMLAATGVAGCPDSFFRAQSFGWWADYLGVRSAHWNRHDKFETEYLAAVTRYGKSDSELFGMRLMWESKDDFFCRLAELFPVAESEVSRLQSIFGKVKFFHLFREDKVAQAISRLRAEQSGLWHKHANGSERERLSPQREIRYDFLTLNKWVTELELHDEAWENWFLKHGIGPVRISYESLSSNLDVILKSILIELGVDYYSVKPVRPQTSVLADSTSLRWARQFEEDKASHR